MIRLFIAIGGGIIVAFVATILLVGSAMLADAWKRMDNVERGLLRFGLAMLTIGTVFTYVFLGV